jgi:two-component system, OmpR family, phosphate regulon sensor histidine kinase PhoR
LRQSLPVIFFSFVPTLVLSSVGILILVYERAGFDIAFGILVLIFSVAVLTGGFIVLHLLHEQTRRARLQTDFVAKVSHELRTPLASIRMFVDTLRNGAVTDPGERMQCLDVISAETSRLTRLIERLLRWGRMESGRLVYTMRPESVSALVGEALAQAETQIQTAGMVLDLDLPSNLPAIRADREALVEALLNLVSNAIKYGAGGGRLIVRVRVGRKGRRVMVVVEDRGPGIPRHEHSRIFEKFYRGKSDFVRQTKGSGLGLAMASLVVRAHGGSIQVASAPGSGACFTVDLPALAPATTALEVPAG